MPLFNEDGEEVELKFGEECVGCKFAAAQRACRRCDVGELFEESDPEGLDGILRF
jgi:hypothetical protein